MELILTPDEERRILISRGLCPVCGESLEENEYGEDENVYYECSKNTNHYSKYLGMAGDLDEYED